MMIGQSVQNHRDEVSERGEPTAPPLMHVEDLRVRYRNGAIGVHGISFDVFPGSVVALFGPNGAGKTTTLRAVSGFVRSEGSRVVNGEVVLAGHNVTNSPPHKMARRGVSLVSERRKIFPNMTVHDNLRAMKTRVPKRRQIELTEQIDDMFPTLLSRRQLAAGRLSGGQQQMLALARGILSDPKLLLIDELTMGLHHSLHESLFDAVRRISNAGTAVVVVDESAGLALQMADYCYLMANGRVVQSGPRSLFEDQAMVAGGYVDGREAEQ
ncbi:ATP-binding cassette domain-containing protein [Streptomyces sp. NPDC001982]|uniref:ABC transporter ATP-binding protein n=1 Tax=Streptomyces sp. NPDC001982 TaxID=3154405 RepID=UPI00331C6D17